MQWCTVLIRIAIVPTLFITFDSLASYSNFSLRVCDTSFMCVCCKVNAVAVQIKLEQDELPRVTLCVALSHYRYVILAEQRFGKYSLPA